MKRRAVILTSALTLAVLGGCSSTTSATTPVASAATMATSPAIGRPGAGGPPSDRGPGAGMGAGMGAGSGTAAPGGTVTAAPPAGTVAAAWEALMGPDGEYAAAASYQAVIAKFGAVEPYVSIEAMEQNHIQALTRQLSRFGYVPPANPFAGPIAAPADLVTDAQARAEGGRQNVAMYDRLAAAAAGAERLKPARNHLRRQ